MKIILELNWRAGLKNETGLTCCGLLLVECQSSIFRTENVTKNIKLNLELAERKITTKCKQ